MRRVLFLLPAILSPYLLIGFFVLMYCSPLFVHTVAGGNIFVVIAVLFAFFFIAVISTVLYFILALTQRWDSLSVAKTAMLIKLIHIPAYVIIFVLGFLFVLTIWLMLFTVLLAILDYVFLLMTGAVISQRSSMPQRRANAASKAIFGW